MREEVLGVLKEQGRRLGGAGGGSRQEGSYALHSSGIMKVPRANGKAIKIHAYMYIEKKRRKVEVSGEIDERLFKVIPRVGFGPTLYCGVTHFFRGAQ